MLEIGPETARTSVVATLAALAAAVLASLLVGGETGAVVFTVLAIAFPVTLMSLGALRSSSASGKELGPIRQLRVDLGGVWICLCVLLALLEVCGGAMLVLRGKTLEGPWFFGLPGAAVVQLLGFWLGPLLLVGIGYALTFDSQSLRQDELKSLRDRFGKDEDD